MGEKIIMGFDPASGEDMTVMAVNNGGRMFIVGEAIASAILSREPMPTISLKQPWAWLIVNGYKPVENRDWKTKLRGPVLIHASQKIDKEGYRWVAQNFPEIFEKIPAFDSIAKGGIVGAANLVDCVEKHLSLWFFGKYGFVMEDAVPLPFQPLKGELGFFRTKYTGGNIG